MSKMGKYIFDLETDPNDIYIVEDEFVLDFTELGSITPIDIVSEITGLSYDEIRSISETINL